MHPLIRQLLPLERREGVIRIMGRTHIVDALSVLLEWIPEVPRYPRNWHTVLSILSSRHEGYASILCTTNMKQRELDTEGCHALQVTMC